MADLIRWLFTRPDHRLVPLFDTQGLVVRTNVNRSGRRLLARSPEMEDTVISLVEDGLRTPDWQGLIYIMGSGAASDFRPMYVGAAQRAGHKHEINSNILNIHGDKGKFAGWGDLKYYNIGDLSNALFGKSATQGSRFGTWAGSLFRQYDPPILREHVSLFLMPWYGESVGLSGTPESVLNAKKNIIEAASTQFVGGLLNVRGRR
jgi:hypothetical protein